MMITVLPTPAPPNRQSCRRDDKGDATLIPVSETSRVLDKSVNFMVGRTVDAGKVFLGLAPRSQGCLQFTQYVKIRPRVEGPTGALLGAVSVTSCHRNQCIGGTHGNSPHHQCCRPAVLHTSLVTEEVLSASLVMIWRCRSGASCLPGNLTSTMPGPMILRNQ